MPSLDNAKIESQYIMFKGDPGTRKSTQALTYPKPQFWLSWDKKMKSLLLPMRKWGIDPKQIQYEDYTDWEGARSKLESLAVNCPFKTIVADSITSAADCTLRQTLKLKQGVTRKSGGAAGKLVAGIAINEIEDYNAEASALQELIALTKDIQNFHKVNIILIAHVIQAEYKSTGGQTNFSRTIVTAGKRIAPKIPAYCEEVYHFNIQPDMNPDAEGKYTLLTSHTGDDFARTQLELPTKIEFGNNQLYLNYIKPAIDKLNGA